tara:strand:- start:263 stop:454 length:192 start_codon:yes stop_codon:yes gene_type:complete
MSFAIALRFSFGLPDQALRLEQAVEAAITAGFRTADLIRLREANPCSTTELGDAVIQFLDNAP